MKLNRLHSNLLRGASSVALVATIAMSAPSAANAQEVGGPAGTYLSLEGGAACPFGDTIDIFGTDLLNDGCGWTGRIGVGQRNTSVLGMFDSWGLYVRHTRFPTNNGSYYYGAGGYYIDLVTSADEQRTVVDFEVGQDIGIGSGGSRTRWIAGVRYADHRVDTGVDGYYYGVGYFTQSFDTHLWGIGPRIGLESRMPFSSNMGLALGGAIAALYGEHSTQLTAESSLLGSRSASESDTGWALNAEGEAGIYWNPGAGSSELVLGVRGDWWRADSDIVEVSRHNWGPFLRYQMSLGGQ